jgi:hypothetical protein
MNYEGFLGPSNQNLSTLADCERTMNLYFEPRDVVSGRPALYPTPGFQAFIALTGGITDVGGRALYQMNNRALGVIGGGVYEFFATQLASRYGTVAQDNNLAQIVTTGISGLGGDQALIASGGNAYKLNLVTNTLSAAVLTGEATQIGMLDGYGIAFNRAAGKIRLSNLNDFATWDPTQFALRSSAPDNWQAMLVNAPDLILIGEQSGDIWQNVNNFPFPFAPLRGASFKYGIAASFSLAAGGDSVLWLSKNDAGAGIVVRMRGYVPQRVSSYALETAISTYQRTSRIDDAEAFSYQQEGHTVYVLRFPSVPATWAYDLGTNQWAERGKWNAAANRFDAWMPRVHCLAFGKHLVGDPATGTISDMDITYLTELDGGPKRWIRIPPALFADGERLYVDQVRLSVETGLATILDADGTPRAPRVMMRVSLNGGKTWGPERTRAVGTLGEYGEIVQLNLCGSARQTWVPEVSGSDAVPFRILGAEIEGSGFAAQTAA